MARLVSDWVTYRLRVAAYFSESRIADEDQDAIDGIAGDADDEVQELREALQTALDNRLAMRGSKAWGEWTKAAAEALGQDWRTM